MVYVPVVPTCRICHCWRPDPSSMLQQWMCHQNACLGSVPVLAAPGEAARVKLSPCSSAGAQPQCAAGTHQTAAHRQKAELVQRRLTERTNAGGLQVLFVLRMYIDAAAHQASKLTADNRCGVHACLYRSLVVDPQAAAELRKRLQVARPQLTLTVYTLFVPCR